MKCFSENLIVFIAVSLVMWIFTPAYSQTYDTISNWEGITQNWSVYGGLSGVTANPDLDEINGSEHCFRVVTIESLWDNMNYEMSEYANFDSFPRYRLKVLAPITGGDVTMKFENINNTYSHEIVKTPVPGQWTELEFDFSGLYYDSLIRMVIFFDFEGTTPGISWYFDDIMKEIPAQMLFESNLPIVVINTFGVPIPDDPKVTGHMGIIDNGINELNHMDDPFNSYDGYVGIETRGHSTQMFPKKSYGFETRDSLGENLNVSILGMPEESDWILYAPYTDKSMLRNTITFDMGHELEGYCTRTVYCELVLNNDYKGVYVMMEKIKKDENRVDIASLKPDEITGEDLTGGYILAVDWLDPDFTYNEDGWVSNPVPAYPNAMDITFQYYYPKPEDIVPQQRTYIRDFITTAENNLTSAGFTHHETGYNNYFDLPSFVDFMLLNEISKEVDKYRLSQYFFKEKDSDGGKLFAGPPWDFNLGYGNVDYWAPGIDFTGWVYTNVQPVDYSIVFWWKRMMEDPYFNDLAKTRWVSLRQNGLTDAKIHSAIDSIVSYIDTAKDRNYLRWPILGQYVWPNYDWMNNTYADEVDYFENFLFNRLHWMDYNLPGKVLNPSVSITAETNRIMLKINGDYFRRKTLKKEYFGLNNAPLDMTIQTVEYKNSSECILTLSDVVIEMPKLSVTVSELAINTWEDITSNKLESAGFSDKQDYPLISVFADGQEIHIRSQQPELLSEQMEILNINGQTLATYKLKKQSENIFSHQLKPGMYLIIFSFSTRQQVLWFAVLK